MSRRSLFGLFCTTGFIVGFTIALGAPSPAHGECSFENLGIGQAFPASQLDPDFPFYAEAADDFVFVGAGPDCLLETVTFAGNVGSGNPAGWDGVRITIYEERASVCSGQAVDFACSLNASGPGGYPVDSGDHFSCCASPTSDPIVCDIFAPVESLDFLGDPIAGNYEITVNDLDAFDCALEKDRTYWIAPTPQFSFLDFEQGFAFTSTMSFGAEGQQVFLILGLPWSTATQASWPYPDLHLAVEGSSTLQLDIKPDSIANPINLTSEGVIPVLVPATNTFDPMMIDRSTLAFGPAAATAKHEKNGNYGHFEYLDEEETQFVGLVAHFSTQETGIASGDTEACLTGELLDGTPFEACDSIFIVPACGIGFELVFVLPPLMWARRRAGRR
jgi:hypothetical protein